MQDSLIPGSSPTSAGVTISGLRKSFGDNLVLDGISMNVEPGSVTA